MRRRGLTREGLLEACWLGLLASVPLFFNTYSHYNFEDDKAALLLCAAALLCWLRLAPPATAPAQPPGRPPTPAFAVMMLAAAFLLTQVLASLGSISPWLSIRGVLGRGQGLVTSVALVVVFAVMATRLGGAARIQRAVSVMVMAGTVAALYGLVQHHGLDPLAWSLKSRSAARSTQGNEIFMGAWLVMTLPLTAVQVLMALPRRVSAAHWGAVPTGLGLSWLWWTSLGTGVLASGAVLLTGILGSLRGRSNDPTPALSAGLVSFAVQAACLVATGSRGPFLGACAALLVLALGLAALKARVWLARALVLLACLGVLALATRDLPGSPSAMLAEVPGFSRLSQVFTRSGSAGVRLALWQGATLALQADPLRAVVGHGPDTQHLVYARHYPPGLESLTPLGSRVNRAHNHSLDVILGGGLLALAAYWALVLAAGLLALRIMGIGLRPSPVTALLLAAAALGSGTAVYLLDGSARLLWILLPLIPCVGLAAGLMRAAAPGRASSGPRGGAGPDALLALALLAGLVGHLLESHVGIATLTTRLHFWVFLALLVALGRGALCGTRDPPTPPGTTLRALMVLAWLMTLVLGFDFSPVERPFLELPGLFWLMASSWVLLGVLIQGTGPRQRTRLMQWIEGGALFLAGCLTALLLARLAFGNTGLTASVETPVLATLGALLLIPLLGIGWLLSRHPAGAATPTPLRHRAIQVLMATALAVLTWELGLRPIHADMLYARARNAHLALEDLERALPLYRQAVATVPGQPAYLTGLATALTERATAAGREGQRDADFSRAVAVMESARSRHPLDPEPVVNLARAHARWAFAGSPAARSRRLGDADRLYGEAVALTPTLAGLWNEWGRNALALGDEGLALARHERARDLDPGLAGTSRGLGNVSAALEDWPAARRHFTRALELDNGDPGLHRALAGALIQLGQPAEAAGHQARAIALEPGNLAARRDLLRIHLEAGECDAAVSAALATLILAPRDPHSRALSRLVRRRCGG